MEDKEDCFHLGVKALIQNGEGKLLLLRLDPKKIKDPRGEWDIPGGRIHRDESMEDALRREVYEETGLDSILQIIPFKMSLSPLRLPTRSGHVGLVLATYLCSCIDTNRIQLSDEHIDFDWVDPKRAAELLKTNFPVELIEALLNF